MVYLNNWCLLNCTEYKVNIMKKKKEIQEKAFSSVENPKDYDILYLLTSVTNDLNVRIIL